MIIMFDQRLLSEKAMTTNLHNMEEFKWDLPSLSVNDPSPI